MTSADEPGFGVLRIRDLSALAYTQGFTLWHYAGQHLPLHRMMVPGFFDPALGDKLMRRGDIILISANDGGACVFVAPGSQGAAITLTPINSPLA